MTASAAKAAHRVAAKALGWLHAHRERGTLPSGTTAELTDPASTYKPIGETALACSLVLREAVSGTGEMRIAQELSAFVWRELRDGDLLYERQLRQTLMTDPLELYAHFFRAGHRHARLEELLRHHAALGSVQAVELPPNRRLAVANAARIIGLDLGDDWDALAAATWLGRTPEPWAIDWMTAYCLTHTVFHLTDWGARPEALPPALTPYVRAWLPVWLDVWREVEQWDLFAELLIVGACLTEPHCDPHDWELLAAVQREDGLVPRDGAPVDEDPQQAYADHHHPTVVTAVAGTLALSRVLGAPAARS